MSPHEPPHPRRARFLMALLAGILALGLGQAQAQEQGGKRIVLMPFSGSGAKYLRRAAAEALLQGAHEIVPDRDYKRAARKQKARGLEPENVALVAGALGADGVLLGEVDKADGKRLGTLRLLSGKTGEQVAEIRIAYGRRRLAPEEEEEVRTRLLAAVATLPALSGSGGAGGARSPGAGDIEDAGDGDGAAPDSGPATTQARDEEIPALGDDDEVPGEVLAADTPVSQEPPAKSEGVAGHDAIELIAGLSFTRRALSSSTEGDVVGPEYTGALAPGLQIALEIYPMALKSLGGSSPGVLGNLGIRAHLDRVVGLTSELPYMDPENPGAGELTAELGTTQMQMGVGLVYRQSLGDGATAPSLVFGIGFQRLQFSVDEGDAPAGVVVDLPSVAYASIDPGLTFRYPLSDTLALDIGGKLLLVTSSGDIQDEDEFGGGSALGFDLGAGAEYRLSGSLSMRAGLRLIDIGTSFDGTGPESNLRDGNPDTVDVTGVNDLYLGGQVTAGYRF